MKPDENRWHSDDRGLSLLSFTAANHRSILEAQTLTLMSGHNVAKAPEKGWISVIHPVTVLMGPNGAGKSNLLDALHFALHVIRLSATSWQSIGAGAPKPNRPFRLGNESGTVPSTYEFEFVLDGMRYVYGFEWRYDGMHREWLSRVPGSRWTVCFDRLRGEVIDWNKSFMPASAVRELGKVMDTELVMSVALRSEHSVLGGIARGLVKGCAFIPVGESSQRHRERQLAALIRSGDLNLDDVSQLLIAADTGIRAVTLEHRRLPPEDFERLQNVVAALTGASGSGDRGAVEIAKVSDDDLATLVHTFQFLHEGEGDAEDRKISLGDESTGTRAWLSIAPTVLKTLRAGSVLIADELDSSLHQSLVEMLIRAFTDEATNPHGAQLLFSSHNTNFLEHSRELGIRPGCIWFIEKQPNGSSDLFSLADFPNHEAANYERRYLSGRYAALPRVSPSILRGLVLAEGDGGEEVNRG
ncbi:AAA family ATPase [Corynebacterium lizhenjunii]|uniref:AAA family ATPase n=1 Tax=Corynebacterium lizhenjunii TaxID=2709394 RepID=UPI0013E9DE1F|nr:ATP-binding protein [Corynebacterium lizhenjunii]